jgi:four helix bundle protein
MESHKTVKSFRDLEVYQNSYRDMILVFKHIIPKLPKEEDYDLKDQLRRSVKSIPRLIAEGHSKRHQRKGLQKYIDDAMAESNETIVSLNQVNDIYFRDIDKEVCEKLMDSYDKTSRQLYKLALAWDKFSKINRRITDNDSSSETDNQKTKTKYE